VVASDVLSRIPPGEDALVQPGKNNASFRR